MKIFTGLIEPFYVVVKGADVGQHILYGAKTHREMLTMAISLLGQKKEVIGLVRTLNADISVGEQFGDGTEHYLVALRGDEVVDYTPISHSDQGAMMQLVFAWTSRPRTIVKVMSAEEIKGKI